MNVVTSAMITSDANSAFEITPFSSARLSTISSVSPRVFISVPMTADARQSKPVSRAAIIAPTSLPTIATAISTSGDEPQLGPVEQADIRAQAGVGEEHRQEQRDHEVLDAAASRRA